MHKQAIILAIDNVSDNLKAIEQTKMFLNVGFGPRSIVVVTSCSIEVLQLRHLTIDESGCLKMPELDKDEAESLFLQRATCDNETRSKLDDEIIGKCLERCYFQEGDGERSCHYHPLALKVFCIQLGCNTYDRKKWAAVLKELDTFNGQREEEHPLFSILRESFDTLLPEDRILFMDIALYLPEDNLIHDQWLCMVHERVHDMMERVRLVYALHFKCRNVVDQCMLLFISRIEISEDVEDIYPLSCSRLPLLREVPDLRHR